MKLSKIEWAVLILTGLFLAFTTGYFAGSSSSGTVLMAGGVTVVTDSESSENPESETSSPAENAEETAQSDATHSSEAVQDTVVPTGNSEEQLESDASLSEHATASETASSEIQVSDAQTSALININTATAEELETLPGIGEELASRIIAYRESYGAFQAIEDITNVNGIGDGRFSAIQDYITVGE